MNSPYKKHILNWSKKRLLCFENNKFNSLLIQETLLPTGIVIDFCLGKCNNCDNCSQPSGYDIILLNIQNSFKHIDSILKNFEEFSSFPPVIAFTSVPKDDLSIGNILVKHVKEYLLLPLGENTLKNTLIKYLD